jgi:uncharacterized protein DUF4231
MNRTSESEQESQHYLLSQVEDCLHTFNSKRQINKHLALGLKLFAAFLSAAITVLLGISYSTKPDLIFKNVAIGLSAFVAVINAWDAFFNHRTLWVRYTIAANRMRSLREEIRYRLARDQRLSDEYQDRFFAQYQQIIADLNNAWEELRRSEQNKPGAPDRDRSPQNAAMDSDGSV